MCKKFTRLMFCGLFILSFAACDSDESLVRKIQSKLKIEVRAAQGFSTDECGMRQLRAFHQEFKRLSLKEQRTFLAQLRDRYTQIDLSITAITAGYELRSYHVSMRSDQELDQDRKNLSPHYKSEKLIHTELKGDQSKLNFAEKPLEPTQIEVDGSHLKIKAHQSVVIDKGYGYLAHDLPTYVRIQDKTSLDEAIYRGEAKEVLQSFQSKAACGALASLNALLP